MKKAIYSLFKKIFADQFYSDLNVVRQETEVIVRNEMMAQRDHCKDIELQMFIGKPVISISNEWTDPIIGFGKEIAYITQAKTPVLIVENYITGEDNMLLSDPLYFTEQRFNALAKLDPFEICSIIYHRSSFSGSFNKNKSGIFTGYDKLREKLETSGFFERVKVVEESEVNN